MTDNLPKFILGSCLGHLFLILVLSTGFLSSGIKTRETRLIHARLVVTPSHNNQTSHHIQSRVPLHHRHLAFSLSQSMRKVRVHKYRKRLHHHQPVSVHPHKLSQSKLSQSRLSGHHHALLLIIHNLILQHQQYPMAALLESSAGNIKLRFLLSASGVVSAIHIVYSDAGSVLNQAAMAAVRAISPVRQASTYLTRAQSFTVWIRFKLPED